MLYIDNRIYDSISFNYVSFKYAVGVLEGLYIRNKKESAVQVVVPVLSPLKSLTHNIHISKFLNIVAPLITDGNRKSPI